MKRSHRLVKLRSETVMNLKRLVLETGKGSLDDLIMTMIRLTDGHRASMKETGWQTFSGGDRHAM